MTITAKFDSTCTQCRRPVHKGQSVEWTRGARGVYHTDCASANASSANASSDTGYKAELDEARATHRARSRRPSYGSHYARFSSGAEVFTNARGRCEDAPCCGCCS